MNRINPMLLMNMSADKKIEALRKIVQTRAYKEIDGVVVDISTANLILQVYDNLSSENKRKYADMPIEKMGSVAWKLGSGKVKFEVS